MTGGLASDEEVSVEPSEAEVRKFLDLVATGTVSKVASAQVGYPYEVFKAYGRRHKAFREEWSSYTSQKREGGGLTGTVAERGMGLLQRQMEFTDSVLAGKKGLIGRFMEIVHETPKFHLFDWEDVPGAKRRKKIVTPSNEHGKGDWEWNPEYVALIKDGLKLHLNVLLPKLAASRIEHMVQTKEEKPVEMSSEEMEKWAAEVMKQVKQREDAEKFRKKEAGE